MGHTINSRIMFLKTEFDVAVHLALNKLGFDQLKDHQKSAIYSLVEGNDTFISLPTGSSKSLCYWILPSIFTLCAREGSVVIVVSPLIALMKNQVSTLNSRNVKAIYTGSLDDGSKSIEMVKRGEYSIMFFSPENLLSNVVWRDVLQSPTFQEKLVTFVVDESHCVKQW